jgi:hypothetical protein
VGERAATDLRVSVGEDASSSGHHTAAWSASTSWPRALPPGLLRREGEEIEIRREAKKIEM